MNDKDNRDQYLNHTFLGRELSKKFPDLTISGVWAVYGEDPNCDFGGHHHSPFLGKFRGRLTDVIDHAVNLPSFWSWGAGGSIKMSAPKDIVDIGPSTAQIQELNEKFAALDAAQKELAASRRKFGIKE